MPIRYSRQLFLEYCRQSDKGFKAPAQGSGFHCTRAVLSMVPLTLQQGTSHEIALSFALQCAHVYTVQMIARHMYWAGRLLINISHL